MTWITNDGSSTVNMTHTSGAEIIFHVKELLKTVGWTVLMSSDGSSYSAISDVITTASSGAGGMDNNNAWFRIQDPAGNREYVFQRGTSQDSWKWIYSASDGFKGGSPGVFALPTATDQQGLCRNSIFFQNLFPAAGTWRTHIAAQDTPYNGVYAWWCCVYDGADGAFLCCDPIGTTASSGDADPCVHCGTDDTPTLTFLSPTNASWADSFKCWMKYGESDAEWGGITAAYYTALSYATWPDVATATFLQDPHDTYYKFAPINWFRHSDTGSVTGYKGFSKYIHFNVSTAYSYTDLIQSGSDYWLVWGILLLPGWPNSTLPGT